MYELDTSSKITKELLLSKNSQETYFEHYLGVPVKKGLFRSPPIIRIDNKTIIYTPFYIYRITHF